jgi:hypothetical protein
MVVEQETRSLAEQLWHGLQQDLGGLLARFAPAPEPVPAGMYTYRIDPGGGQRRIHLRVEADGSGVMFVDVTDVIHLNETAVTMTKLALDGIPQEVAARRFVSHFHVGRQQVANELTRIYEMVERFQEPGIGCPTCSLNGLDRAPLFSQRARAPYKADLALTYGCNNECPHCYNEPDRFEMPSMPKEEWFRVLDQLYEVGVPHLIFTGGEATLHPDLLEIINYADSLGMVCGLNTNGRRIAHAPYMEELAASGLNHIQVTLGSHKAAVHDAMMGAKSFDQTVRGIQKCGGGQRPRHHQHHPDAGQHGPRRRDYRLPLRIGHSHLCHERYDLLRRRLCRPQRHPRRGNAPPAHPRARPCRFVRNALPLVHAHRILPHVARGAGNRGQTV